MITDVTLLVHSSTHPLKIGVCVAVHRIGARRPYITHAVELLDILAEVNASVTGIEDVLAASRAEHDAETAEAGQTELREAYV